MDAEPNEPLVADVRWHTSPGWRDVLLGPQGLRLAQWLGDGRATVVKHGTHRTVYRVDLPEGSVFLKHDHSPSLLRAGRHLVRSSTARREYRKALELERRQVPTTHPVAYGEQRRGGLVADSFLVTEAIPHSVPLDEYVQDHLPRLPADEQRAMLDKLAMALAELCATVHRAGVDHDDFHAGNILVQGSGVGCQGSGKQSAAVRDNGTSACGLARLTSAKPQAEVPPLATTSPLRPDPRPLAPDPRLFLVDVPGVRFSRSLGWSASRRALVVLNAAWTGKVPDSVRQLFWETYLLARPELQLADAHREAQEIGEQSRRYARRLLAGRDRRALATNRDFQAIRTTHGRAHAVAGVMRADVERLLADPQHPIRDGVERPVKLSHSAVIVESTLPVAGQATPVAYKRMRARSWSKRWLAKLRPSRALRAWRLGHALVARGIATARPLAVLLPRCGAEAGDAYLLTEWLTGSENLHLYGWRLAKLPESERRVRTRQAARSLGQLIGRMHAWHVLHRDLKGCNLLLTERAGDVDAYLLDMEGVRIARSLPYREQVRNLARLATSLELHPWVTRSDRWRFLRTYAAGLSPEAVDFKRLWHDVARASGEMIAELRKRKQPVA